MEGYDVYILGAGASFVHRAPLTNDILPYALSNAQEKDLQRQVPLKRLIINIVWHDL